MNRTEFISKIALMDDDDFSKIVKVVQEGGLQAPNPLPAKEIEEPNLHPSPKGIKWDNESKQYVTDYWSDSSKEELKQLDDLLNSEVVKSFMQSNNLVKYKQEDGRFVLIPKEEVIEKKFNSSPGMAEIKPGNDLQPVMVNGELLYVDENGEAFKFKEGGAVPKQVKLCKNGSILDQLKDQLGDSEIVDILQHFGIDDLMQGGLKDTGTTSISITIMSSEDAGEKIPEIKKIEIGDKSYEVEVVSTDEDMKKGLSEKDSLDASKGMLFDFKEVQDSVVFNMKEMKFPIDIIFINNDDEVVKVAKECEPGDDLFTCKNVKYVLEVNTNSGIKKGDELDLDPEEDTPVMKVLAPDGSTQYELVGGERIFSRVSTKRFIKWAKRCEKTKSESDYKRLGNMMFKEIHAQDNRDPEYVELPEN